MPTKMLGKRANSKVQTIKKVASGEIVECCCGIARLTVESFGWRGGVDVSVYTGKVYATGV